MKTEIWKDIPKYEGYYQASNLGRVKRVKRNSIDKMGRRRLFTEKIICSMDNGNGYHQVGLTKGKLKTERVARIIAMTFYPVQPANKIFVNHIDGNKKNNRVENLEWVTPSENIIHAWKLGLIRSRRGADCNFAKLTDKDVVIIHRSILTPKVLSEKYNVTISLISQIKNKKIWKHLF